MLTHKMNTWVISPPEIFGDFSSVDGESWNPELFVYAFEGPAEVISIDNTMLSKYYNNLVESKDWNEFTELLSIAIPGFSGKTISTKESISSNFVEKKFQAGSIIVPEGQILTTAYIIKHGTCKVFSTGIPKLLKDEEDDQEVIMTWENLKNNKGYFSDTTNHF